ncbi:ARM repeat-containing protein [Backusella circina FSU 941]|nr:ARM repeat-containing protein [Backusella circina FSU 941]
MTDARIQLVEVLKQATSQDYAQMRQAEGLLKQWENSPSFFATLQDIFYDGSVEHDLRILSGIYLKNGVDRFWRKTAANPINPEEKATIRQRLLQFLDEPSNKLTAQNAVIVARIARLDYPREWPNLLSDLILAMDSVPMDNQNYARLVHHRTLETLSEVLSELSTRLLTSGRKQFAEIAPSIFQAVARIYVAYADMSISMFNDTSLDQAAIAITLDIISICVRCLRILMVSGIKDVHKYNETKTFLEISLGHLERYVNIRYILLQANMEELRLKLEDLIEGYGSLYLGLQKDHPVSVILCPCWLDIIRYYWQNVMMEGSRIEEQCKTGNQTDSHAFEQFLLQGILIIKDTIKNSTQSSNTLSLDLLSITEEEKSLALEANRIIHEKFLTPDFVHKCAETLVSQYMLLTPADFTRWEEDPEGWANSLDSENWEFELRPCAEVTFMSLLSHYRDALIPILLNLVERVEAVNDHQGLLFKDAVYGAIGLGVHSLYGKFDFEPFVMNRLVVELKHKERNFVFLRRRIAWLLSKWVNEGISSNCRSVIYEMLLDLMDKNEDMVVRLAAANGLKNAVDDWDFDIEIVLPYLNKAIGLLLCLFSQIEEADTQMKMLAYITSIIDRTGEHIIPYADQIMQLLAPHWSDTSEPMLLNALVIAFTKIAFVLDEKSIGIHDMLLSIVAVCINREYEGHIYLLEDSLDLWWTILQTTPTATPRLMELYPKAIELLDYDTENLHKVLKIIESYLLLDAPTCMKYALELFSKLALYMNNTRTVMASYLVHTLDIALTSVPLQVYGESLIQSNILSDILHLLLKDEMYGYALMNYMNIYARLAIFDANFVINYIQLTGQQQNMPGDFMGDILDKWMDKFDTISHIRSRKLGCIAFINLLRTGNESLLKRTAFIMSVWTSVCSELVEEADNEGVLYGERDVEEDIYEIATSAEKNRKDALYRNDVVYKTDVVELMRQAINENAGLAQIISQLDPTIIELVKQILG